MHMGSKEIKILKLCMEREDKWLGRFNEIVERSVLFCGNGVGTKDTTIRNGFEAVTQINVTIYTGQKCTR